MRHSAQMVKTRSGVARSAVTWVALAALMGLAGCTSPRHRAPVEQRAASEPAAPAAPASAASAAEVAPPAPVTEFNGRVIGYVVKPGDTLIRIGLETGQNWRDIARWSGLDNPNTLEVGQLLRVAPPGIETATATTAPVTGPGRVDVKPLDGRPAAAAASAPATAPTSAPAQTTAAASTAAPTPAAAPPRPAAKDPDEDLNWIWPAAGPVLSPFDDSRNKGLAIGGKAGDPVFAAADGRVVYAGSGLRGYGNLVIVKHNNTFLTAYAHNQTLLVKEDQVVQRGQRIAEMGASDTDRVKLHFEIRRLGKPVDPASYLPPR